MEQLETGNDPAGAESGLNAGLATTIKELLMFVNHSEFNHEYQKGVNECHLCKLIKKAKKQVANVELTGSALLRSPATMDGCA